ncbi:dienelactone hydrolase [Sodiomyces alkalinus F11]|uniref:Dienelactone hydrolase n=1 Tax=Sodiomyces alkalinus (strain CBS 110278 / VKM F-3762 / F11) TaxID=1314773 RepID=A0A3N2PTA3_SODAK|nr:dienelactone hydrolase [Sodiomyces alkalinus F11]ROT37718.1 dienelactone hydrolase [Sodiomyces alkalinus F11]
MTEIDVATKAPESNATEQPAEPIESSPAAGPAVGEHCVTDRPTPAGQVSTGEIIKINDVEVYVSKPADYPHAPARFLLLLTGGTGLKSINNQLQADNFASEGFLVAMPDLFNGDPAPNTTTFASQEESQSLIDAFKLRIVETAKSFQIDMWLARQTEEKVLPILHKVIDGCRDEFADAIKHGDGIYAVGYCIGGRYVLLLGSDAQPTTPGPERPADEEAGETKTGPLIKVGAVAHAASVTPKDFASLRVPVSLACVENDALFPDDVRVAGEDVMSQANLEHEVRVYPGVPHGFAVVGVYEDATIRGAQATAYEQMLSWINEH